MPLPWASLSSSGAWGSYLLLRVVENIIINREVLVSPGQVAQLVRASSQYAKVVGLIPRQGTYVSLSLSLPLKSINK